MPLLPDLLKAGKIETAKLRYNYTSSNRSWDMIRTCRYMALVNVQMFQAQARIFIALNHVSEPSPRQTKKCVGFDPEAALAALPPPPANVAGAPRLSARLLSLAAVIPFGAAVHTSVASTGSVSPRRMTPGRCCRRGISVSHAAREAHHASQSVMPGMYAVALRARESENSASRTASSFAIVTICRSVILRLLEAK